MTINYKLTALAKALAMFDFAPMQSTSGSAGYDLKACIEKEVKIFPGETVKIPTGVHIWLNTKGIAGLYLPRSSTKGLMLENTVGLLDGDYQGESFIKFYNYSDVSVAIQPGQRIAQLVLIHVCVQEMQAVNEFQEQTTRGEGGFGSTGEF
jgi:dUTP pyrophosphatase